MHVKYIAIAAISLACLIHNWARAQASVSPDVVGPENGPGATSPVPVPVPASLPNGTPIMVEITDLVSSRTAKRDDMFNLRLAEPVLLNGVAVIPKGTVGKGQVIDTAKPGIGGKSGKLVLAARYLILEDRQIPIRGLNLDMVGKDRAGASMLAVMSLGAGAVVGLAVTGGNMEVKAGTLARAKLGGAFPPANLVPEQTPTMQPDVESEMTATGISSSAQINP